MRKKENYAFNLTLNSKNSSHWNEKSNQNRHKLDWKFHAFFLHCPSLLQHIVQIFHSNGWSTSFNVLWCKVTFFIFFNTPTCVSMLPVYLFECIIKVSNPFKLNVFIGLLPLNLFSYKCNISKCFKLSISFCIFPRILFRQTSQYVKLGILIWARGDILAKI